MGLLLSIHSNWPDQIKVYQVCTGGFIQVCIDQGDQAGIELGRKYVSFISKNWLKIHITDTVIRYFDYNDDWNYRRLLELVSMEIPEVMNEILEINKASDQIGILECIGDYQ